MDFKSITDRIDSLFNQWQGLQPLNPRNFEYLEHEIRLNWNYHSNRIEGNTLSYGQTELLLIHGRYDGGHTERNYTEMKAHDLAIKKVKEYAQDRERTLVESDIRDFNKIILKGPYFKKAQTPDGASTQRKIIPGEYRTHPNHVVTAAGEIFKFTEPSDVPSEMKELLDWFGQEMARPTMHIISFVAHLHHRFILIHPFDDGNGRVARLWTNYVLLRKGFPPLIIKSEDKSNYLAALNQADVGNHEKLAVYLGEMLIEPLREFSVFFALALLCSYPRCSVISSLSIVSMVSLNKKLRGPSLERISSTLPHARALRQYSSIFSFEGGSFLRSVIVISSNQS